MAVSYTHLDVYKRQAKARGVHFGPQRIQLSYEFDHYAYLWSKGDISSRKAAQRLGISYQTFLRRVKEKEYQKNL